AEDGIRDKLVTGVQTCALPILEGRTAPVWLTGGPDGGGATLYQQLAKMLYTHGSSAGITTEAKQIGLAIKLSMTYTPAQVLQMRSEERRVGKEWRAQRRRYARK